MDNEATTPTEKLGQGPSGALENERVYTSARGPTKDYREFKGQYRGRGYRFWRMTWTNFKTMATSWWSIVVVVITFFFLFFQVIGLAIGAIVDSSAEDLMEEYETFDPEIYFKLEPVDGQPARTTVWLGETYTFSYEVTNTGKDTGGANFILFLPNGHWEGDYNIVGDKILEKGDSLILNVHVTIPETVTNFSASSDQDPFRDLGGQGYFGGETIVHSRPYKDEGDIAEEEPNISVNSIYQYNSSRMIGILCIPDELLEGPGIVDLDHIDIRIRSIGTLLSLDPADEDVIAHFGLQNSASIPELEIWMGNENDEVYRTKMKAPEMKTFEVHMKNTGSVPLILDIDCFIMPLSEPNWYYYVSYGPSTRSEGPFNFEEEYIDPEEGGFKLDPMEERVIEITISSGMFTDRTHYPILITATDISTNRSYHVSDAYHMTISITGSSEIGSSINTRFHDIFWGGGFHYERYLWLILMAAFAGAGITGQDIQENSIAVYFSRPITWYDYLLAKFTSLVLMLSMVTLVPVVLIFSIGMAFSTKDLSYILEYIPVLMGMLFSYLIALVVMASVSMAFSSVIKKWVLSGVGIFAIFFFPSTISDILFSMFDNEYLRLMNTNFVMKNLFKPFYGLKYNVSSEGLDWYILAGSLAMIVVVSWIIIISRFWKKEVAK